MYQDSRKPQRGQDTAIARATYDLMRIAQHARAGGAAVVAGDLAQGISPSNDTCSRVATSETRPGGIVFAIRADVELARIALGLCLSALFRLWLILHQLARDTNTQAFTRAQLDTALQRYGVQGCPAYIARLLKRGNGLFWNIDPRTKKIYPAGYVNLSQRLLTLTVRKGLPDLFLHGNHPGSRRPMFINVSGTVDNFEAAVLASWYHAHEGAPLSRLVITTLFNRDRRAIWRLERLANVEIIYNEAETTDPYAIPLDANGNPRGDVYTTTDTFLRTVYHFRMANSYVTHMIRQHPRFGQGRRAAYTFRRWLDTLELHGDCEAGSGCAPMKLNPTGRVYCKDDKTVKRSRKRGNVGTLYAPDRPGQGGRIVWGVYTHSM